MVRITPAESPPLLVVAPFFVAAPLALVAAGLGAALAGGDSFIAVNARHNVAVTHAIVLGWLTLTMMGALYQLGSAVLGTPMRWQTAARVQFAMHVGAVATFVPSLWLWKVTWMTVAGSLAFLSISLFLVNSTRFTTPRTGSPAAASVVAARVALLAAVTIGITFVGNQQHGWFAITPGRLAAHAHAGLVGWIGVTLMGISYQLVPMFNVVHNTRPRFARQSLVLTVAGLMLFAGVMTADPPRAVRLLVATPLICGFALWGADQVLLLRGRARRHLDIQGRASVVSLAFLVVTCATALGVAWGTPMGTEGAPARWPVAYGLVATLGWAGTAVIGNSHKILAFLTWFHRYRGRMGNEQVPLLQDLYSERGATAILVLHSGATMLLFVGALAGNLVLLHAGGVALAGSGLLQAASLGSILIPRRRTGGQRLLPGRGDA